MKSIARAIVVWLLTLEARMILEKYQPKIVAVTGSVGKTSTKDALATVLSATHHTRKSHKSFNSEIGVPLTILGCPNAWGSAFGWIQNLCHGLWLVLCTHDYPEWLVLEVGADKPGDIRALTRWLQPDVVVVTRLPSVPVHVEFFSSPAEVIEEKAALVDALKDDGTLILNNDDAAVCALTERVRGRVVTYGFNPLATVQGSGEWYIYRKGVRGIPEGMAMHVKRGEDETDVSLMGAVGQSHLYTLLAALALGVALEQELAETVDALAEHVTPPGRMRLLEGLKDTIIIDDSYNSSPAASENALDTLKRLTVRNRRIAVLGDMLELGSYSYQAHIEVGKQAGSICDILLTVGERAHDIAEGALRGGLSEKHIYQFEDARQAGSSLQNLLEPGDIVLIKGSQSGIRLERTVEEIMLHPEDKTRLLVRQEPEWLER